MAEVSIVCDRCQTGVTAVFAPNTGSRQTEVIAGDLLVTDECFVRDEIRFINNGRLIFVPGIVPGEDRKNYL